MPTHRVGHGGGVWWFQRGGWFQEGGGGRKSRKLQSQSVRSTGANETWSVSGSVPRGSSLGKPPVKPMQWSDVSHRNSSLRRFQFLLGVVFAKGWEFLFVSLGEGFGCQLATLCLFHAYTGWGGCGVGWSWGLSSQNVGWSRMSGRRTPGTSRSSLGPQALLLQFLSKVWANTWKAQTSFYQTSATSRKYFLDEHVHTIPTGKRYIRILLF